MKIHSLTIGHLHRFKNFHLDLTYPIGHSKEGQPLDKVCFIGQSGTGKTTLLKILKTLTYGYEYHSTYSTYEEISSVEMLFSFDNINAYKTIGRDDDDSLSYFWDDSKIRIKNEVLAPDTNIFDFAFTKFKNYQASKTTDLFYFPAELNYTIEKSDDIYNNLSQERVIDFSIHKAADSWQLIMAEIQKFQEEELKIRQEISKVAEEAKDIQTIKRALKKLEELKQREYNPIEEIANLCLNPILSNFGVRVKTDLDIQKKEDLGFIKIVDYNNQEIPIDLLSTGTKQVILSALPLYLLKPNDAILLYDEPERSLFPDIQNKIIEYYQSFTTNCQLFFSTHSPIIASSFEPWEIVELKFDKNWNIYRELYYEGDNHVDNYFIDPRYLNYELILNKVFDMKDTNGDLRTETIVELTMLKNQLEELKKQKKLQSAEGKEIFKRYQLLSKKIFYKAE